MFTDYADSEIDVLPRNAAIFPISLHTPGGDARGELALPFDNPTYQAIVARLPQLDADEAALIELGQILFRSIFYGPIKDVYTRSRGALSGDKGMRLIISIAPSEHEVAALPWEFLYDPDQGPLALLDTPIVRYLAQQAKIPTLKTDLPLKVLLTASQTPPLIDFERELQAVRASLAHLGSFVEVTVEPHLTVQKLQRRLRDEFHVWHFVGHGGFERDGTTARLAFEDANGDVNYVSAPQLGVLFNRSCVRLVILDACEGARLATDPLRSIAPALVRAQVPAVIAMQFSVPEKATQAFASEFYRALAEGLRIEACVTEGRKQVMNTVGLGKADWGIPVLYTRAPDGKLFDLPPSAQRDSADTITAPRTDDGQPGADAGINGPAGTMIYPPRPSGHHDNKPLPPSRVNGFRDRVPEQDQLKHELGPRGGAWLHGPSGCGITALLRQVANLAEAQTLPDGICYVDGTAIRAYQDNQVSGESQALDDVVQHLCDQFYPCSDETRRERWSLGRATPHLRHLQALFLLDRLPLAPGEFVRLRDALGSGAVLVGADGFAPRTIQDMQLGGLPRVEAVELCVAVMQFDQARSDMALLDGICAALDDLPLPLLLVSHLVRCKAATLEQLIADLDELRVLGVQSLGRAIGTIDHPTATLVDLVNLHGPLTLAAHLSLGALDSDPRARCSGCAGAQRRAARRPHSVDGHQPAPGNPAGGCSQAAVRPGPSRRQRRPLLNRLGKPATHPGSLTPARR